MLFRTATWDSAVEAEAVVEVVLAEASWAAEVAVAVDSVVIVAPANGEVLEAEVQIMEHNTKTLSQFRPASAV
jgi:hypothetical protein